MLCKYLNIFFTSLFEWSVCARLVNTRPDKLILAIFRKWLKFEAKVIYSCKVIDSQSGYIKINVIQIFTWNLCHHPHSENSNSHYFVCCHLLKLCKNLFPDWQLFIDFL